MTTRSRALLLGALVLCGCGSTVPSPVVQSVSPAEAPRNVPTALTVQLHPSFPATFDYGQRSVTLDTRVTLRLGEEEVAVESVGAQQLTAVVPENLLPEGAYDVRVTLADGREGVLRQGFTVQPPTEAAFSFGEIPDQFVGESFEITIRAEGPDARQFEDTVTLTSGKGQVTPRTSGRFTQGERTERVTIDSPGNNWIIATDAAGNVGVSETFVVRPRG